MPPVTSQRCAVVSCHVERPLDDAAWEAFSSLQRLRPGGFRIAALMRPPDPEYGEDEARWLERARAAAAAGPFGLHTHWTAPDHARTSGGDPAARVRREIEWLRARGLEPRFFVGGGWYTDDDVRSALRELDVVDCTATTFALPYAAAHVRVDGPSDDVIPATHTLGMLARGIVGPLPEFVHVYFHDTDLLTRRRRALLYGLRLLALRRRPASLDDVSEALRARSSALVH